MAPTSYRKIGEAIKTSHSQVGRLIKLAIDLGLLRKVNPQGLAYEIVLNPPTPHGLVWVPVTRCSWHGRLCWDRDPDRGVWLDRAVYKIESAEPKELWGMTFPEKANAGQGHALRLNDDALALVRKCSMSELRRGSWYLVERGCRIIPSSYFVNAEGDRGFRVGRRDPEPVFINPKSPITGLAEILMVTARPGPKIQRR